MRSTLIGPTATATGSLVPILQRIADMADLPANWDSYGASRLTASAIARACVLVVAVAEEGEAAGKRHLPWTSAPIPDGGVQIEWKGEAARIDVQISPDGTLGYLIQRGATDDAEYEEDDDLAMDAMIKLISQVVAA